MQPRNSHAYFGRAFAYKAKGDHFKCKNKKILI